MSLFIPTRHSSNKKNLVLPYLSPDHQNSSFISSHYHCEGYDARSKQGSKVQAQRRKGEYEQKVNRDHLNGELLSRGERFVRLVSFIILSGHGTGKRVLDDKDFNAYSLTRYTLLSVNCIYRTYLKVHHQVPYFTSKGIGAFMPDITPKVRKKRSTEV